MTGLTLIEMGRALAEGQVSSEQLVRAHLARIERYDGLLGSIRLVLDDALEQAKASDGYRQSKGARSLLEGVPVALKDNIDVRGVPTTAGALALADSVPPRDAHVVAALRSAGAVILAKTNLSELANFLTDGMPSGYSSLGGQVLNPYDLALTPSGSSSGSAVAVAMEMAAAAVGTETDGSIISPAVHQSLVGVKPTLGLVSRHGIVPIAPSQDTAGPMARTVADAAALLAWMAGPDSTDPATSGAGEVTDHLRTHRLDPGSLSGARLVSVEVGTSGGNTAALGPTTSTALAAAGALMGEAQMTRQAQDDELFVLHYEFAPAVDAYLSQLGDQSPVRTLAQMAEWNRSHPTVALKYGQSHVEQALQIDHERDWERYRQARQRDQQAATAALEDALQDGDALVFRGDEGATWAARSGWPSVSIPIGYSSRTRRPHGLTLVGRAWSDWHLLSLAAGIEAAGGHRARPAEVNPAVFTSRGLGAPGT